MDKGGIRKINIKATTKNIVPWENITNIDNEYI